MTTKEPQILTLHIERVQPGMYRAEVLAHGTRVAGESMHASIAEAIRDEALAVPEGFAHFMEVRYCELSSGTIPLGVIAEQADAIAKHLVDLMSEMRQIAEG